MTKTDLIPNEPFARRDTEKAFEDLFHTYYSSLCLYAAGMIRNHEDAKDLVNDCFFEFWKKRQEIFGKKSVKSYLYISVRNAAVNYLRRKQTEQKYHYLQAYPFYMQEEINSETERLMKMENLEEKLRAAMESLPQQCRYIFYLNRFEQHPYKDIARKLNLSPATVKTQVARALKKMRAEFEDVIEESKIFLSILVRRF